MAVRVWRHQLAMRVMLYERQYIRAVEHSQKMLKVRAFSGWRSALVQLRSERMAEDRIRSTRTRVYQWLDNMGSI